MLSYAFCMLYVVRSRCTLQLYSVLSHAPCSMPILGFARCLLRIPVCIACCNAVQILQFLELPSNVAALEVAHNVGTDCTDGADCTASGKPVFIPGTVVWPYDTNGSATAMTSPHFASCTCGAGHA